MKRINKYPETKTFRFHNANPKGNVTAADCVIRSLAAATGNSWDDTLDELVELCHKHKRIVNERYIYNKYLELYGFVKYKQPAKEDNSKYSIGEFCEHLLPMIAEVIGISDKSRVKVIVTTRSHMACVLWCADAGCFKVHDTWDCTDCTALNYWIMVL